METIKKYWLVPIVILVGLGLYVGFKDGLTNFFSSLLGSNTTAKSAAELENMTYDAKKITLSQNDAVLISQQLVNAMDQWGTDEATILRLLSGKNRDDLLLIIKTFGLKPYNGLGLSEKLDIIVGNSTDLNLQAWLSRELSGSSLAQVSDIFKQNNIAF